MRQVLLFGGALLAIIGAAAATLGVVFTPRGADPSDALAIWLGGGTGAVGFALMLVWAWTDR